MIRALVGVAARALVLALGLAPIAAAGADTPAPAPPMDIPAFREEAAAAGLNHTYGGPWEFFVGGGVAAFDCDQDRKPDLVIAGGTGQSKIFVNKSMLGGPLAFEERLLGLEDGTDFDVLGTYPLDIDADGFIDLVLLRLGKNVILKGEPGCRFKPWNAALRFDGGRAWTAAFAAAWEKGQRFPTLAFGNYVDRSLPGAPWGTCHENDLFRPLEGTAPVYPERTALSPGFCALSMVFSDWNRSGIPSLRIANDRHYYRDGEEQLWRIEPARPPRLYSRSDGWRSVKIWGMGIAVGDIQGDGKPGYAITSMGDTKLQVLDPDADERRPVYRDVAFEKGATAHRPYFGDDLKPSTGWHIALEDMNNDGRNDIFITKGNVEAMPDFASNDPDNLLLQSADGKFFEAGHHAGVGLPTKGRGAAVVDLNLDGMLDLVVVNRGQPVSLFRSLGARHANGTPRPMGNFLHIALRDTESGNRFGIGAEIAVKTGTRTMTRFVLAGGGHASGALGWTHFGLGTGERAEIRIRWPDGAWSHPYRVFANSFIEIDRATPRPILWLPNQ